MDGSSILQSERWQPAFAVGVVAVLAGGPAVLAMFDPSGVKILAKGATKPAVYDVRGLVNGAAVALSNVSVQPSGIVVSLLSPREDPDQSRVIPRRVSHD